MLNITPPTDTYIFWLLSFGIKPGCFKCSSKSTTLICQVYVWVQARVDPEWPLCHPLAVQLFLSAFQGQVDYKRRLQVAHRRLKVMIFIPWRLLSYKQLATVRAPQRAAKTCQGDQGNAADVWSTGRKLPPKLNKLGEKHTSLPVWARKYQHEKLGWPVNAGWNATKLSVMLKEASFSRPWE